MKITITDAQLDPLLDEVAPGDRVTLRAFVNRIEAEAVDVTSLGNSGRQYIKGSKTIELIIMEVDKIGTT